VCIVNRFLYRILDTLLKNDKNFDKKGTKIAEEKVSL
jgi:hypothetical protein